jgi:hypothetical protein
MYIYIQTHMYICIYICTCIYVYIQIPAQVTKWMNKTEVPLFSAISSKIDDLKKKGYDTSTFDAGAATVTSAFSVDKDSKLRRDLQNFRAQREKDWESGCGVRRRRRRRIAEEEEEEEDFGGGGGGFFNTLSSSANMSVESHDEEDEWHQYYVCLAL